MKFQDVKEEAKKYGVGTSNRLTQKDLVVGENRLRILTEFQAFGEHPIEGKTKKEFRTHICIGKDEGCQYCAQGLKVKVQFLGWVIDRKDNQIKLAQFGYKIIEGIGMLAKSEEYGFEFLPSYDIIIMKDGEGLETKYTINAARKDTPLTPEEEQGRDKCQLVEDIINKMKEKEGGKSSGEGIDEEPKDLEEIEPEELFGKKEDDNDEEGGEE